MLLARGEQERVRWWRNEGATASPEVEAVGGGVTGVEVRLLDRVVRARVSTSLHPSDLEGTEVVTRRWTTIRWCGEAAMAPPEPCVDGRWWTK